MPAAARLGALAKLKVDMEVPPPVILISSCIAFILFANDLYSASSSAPTDLREVFT